MELCRLPRPISFPLSRARGLARPAAALQLSGARGVSCCSHTSFSSARVSAPFIPRPDTSTPLPCTHHRADFRSGLTLSRKRSRARLLPLPQEQINSRDEHEVKLQTARRHRLANYYDCLQQGRDSRGRRGAPDASDDRDPAAHRLWAGLAAAPSPRLPRLGCRFWGRLCGPAFRGSWRGRPTRARAL